MIKLVIVPREAAADLLGDAERQQLAHYGATMDYVAIVAEAEKAHAESVQRSVRAKVAAEVFRSIPGFEPYEASNLGRIRRDGRVLNAFQSRGYLYVSPSINGVQKRRAVHQLVCLAWHGQPGEDEEVAHRDGDFLNNRPENLKWTTREEIQRQRRGRGTSNRGQRSPRAKITFEDAVAIVAMAKRKVHPNKIAATYDMSVSHVRNIISGRRWPELRDGVVPSAPKGPW